MRRWVFLAGVLVWLWCWQALAQVPEEWYNQVRDILQSIQDTNDSSWFVMLNDEPEMYSQVRQWHDIETLVQTTSGFTLPLIDSTNILTGATNQMTKTRNDMNAWLSQMDSVLRELIIVAGSAAKESSMTNMLNEVISNTEGLLTETTYISVEEDHEFFLQTFLDQIIELISGDSGPQEDYEQDYETPTGEDYDTPQSDETPNNEYDQEVLNDFDDGTIDNLQSSEFEQVYEGSILPFFAQLGKGDFWGDNYRMPNSLPIIDTMTIGDYTIESYSLPVSDGTFAGSVFKILHDLSATGYAIGFVWSLILLGRREYRYYMSLGRDGGGE